MKKLYEGQKHSLYYLQKALRLDIKRLYRYSNGTYKIESMPFDLVSAIARIEDIEPMKLYKKMIEYQKKKSTI